MEGLGEKKKRKKEICERVWLSCVMNMSDVFKQMELPHLYTLGWIAPKTLNGGAVNDRSTGDTLELKCPVVLFQTHLHQTILG